MSREIPSLPNFEELQTALTKANVAFHPSQVHGLLCGYISATSGMKTIHFLEKIIFGKKKSLPCRELLQHIYETSYHQMSEFSFEFSLLLPDDTADINSRTEALGLWCQGFLTGLERSNISIRKQEKSELADTLNDIVEIAKVSYGDIVDNEDDETAYFELVEYVRLGALMIFQELKRVEPEPSNHDNDHLH